MRLAISVEDRERTNDRLFREAIIGVGGTYVRTKRGLIVNPFMSSGNPMRIEYDLPPKIWANDRLMIEESESGGGDVGKVIVVCDRNGIKLRPWYVASRKPQVCGDHAHF